MRKKIMYSDDDSEYNVQKVCKKRKKDWKKKVRKPKKIWTQEEDELLLKLIEEYGPAKWSIIASFMQNRQGKQCRERWHNHLNPSIIKDPWTE